MDELGALDVRLRESQLQQRRNPAGPPDAALGQLPATLKKLMARLGHSSVRAAMIYQHATRDRDQAIAKALGTLVREARKPTDKAADEPDREEGGRRWPSLWHGRHADGATAGHSNIEKLALASTGAIRAGDGNRNRMTSLEGTGLAGGKSVAWPGAPGRGLQRLGAGAGRDAAQGHRLDAGPQQARPFGPVIVPKAYRLLHSIMNTAVEDGKIRRNPCRIKGAGQEYLEERLVVPVGTLIRLLDDVPPRY